MKMATASLAALLLVTAQLHLVLAFSSVAPAFLWSPHLNGKKEMVDYRILAPRDLAKSAMTEGGWSKYLCSSEEVQGSNNFAFLFIGSELQSLEVSRPSKTDPALIDLLKDSFSNSNSSLAFPYVVAGEEKVSIENSLITEFAETCQHNSGISSIALVGSCSVDGENFDKLNDVHSVHDYLNSRIEKFSDGHTDLIVLCPGGSQLLQDSDQPNSESNILSQLLNAVNEMGAKYTFLYISDPFRSVEYLTRRGIERFLAEGTIGNETTNSTACDGVCQIKSSLLEGILVGIVLLIILISGLCCMMGIDTPTRFETPEAS
ncbi:hypothetical protein C2S53_020542 [Perilla frutescens var. hirtella]|uniref:V-type proton ATPase subunit S1/VOA1 transmembrane domain-containing protein n=1 Tax=Perilla frutescens var. hirtella TaxID=608512 RepID=A0AAD4JA67_PERFH|nr:hypothetical protein C2S53_020542 [Perilla frutescens var. hirtella]